MRRNKKPNLERLLLSYDVERAVYWFPFLNHHFFLWGRRGSFSYFSPSSLKDVFWLNSGRYPKHAVFLLNQHGFTYPLQQGSVLQQYTHNESFDKSFCVETVLHWHSLCIFQLKSLSECGLQALWIDLLASSDLVLLLLLLLLVSSVVSEHMPASRRSFGLQRQLLCEIERQLQVLQQRGLSIHGAQHLRPEMQHSQWIYPFLGLLGCHTSLRLVGYIALQQSSWLSLFWIFSTIRYGWAWSVSNGTCPHSPLPNLIPAFSTSSLPAVTKLSHRIHSKV